MQVGTPSDVVVHRSFCWVTKRSCQSYGLRLLCLTLLMEAHE